ncbi:MAG: alcohol dehydrogenase catalytic domain-containing protein [Jatrophihabitantaceae bacterium]
MVQVDFGGPEVVHLQDVVEPAVGSDDILVRVGACGLNRLDVIQRRGPGVLPGFRLPHIAGMDVAGTVVAAGEAVAGLAAGDRVVVDPTQGCAACRACRAGDRAYCAQLRVIGGNVPGGLAELVAVRADAALRIPDALSLSDAATLPTAWATAWHAVVTAARVAPGECVVVQAGASAISLAIIQLAQRAGATVIAVASTEDKIAAARAAGAALGVQDTDRLPDAVQAFTQGTGADVVIDHVGAATWDASLACLCVGGRMVLLGNTSGDQVGLSLANIFHRGLRLIGAGGYTAEDFTAAIAAAFECSGLQPVAGEFALDELPAAWAAIESRDTVGKVVVVP